MVVVAALPGPGVTALPGVTEPRLGRDKTVGLLMLLSTRRCRRAQLKLTNADSANIVRCDNSSRGYLVLLVHSEIIALSLLIESEYSE